MEQREIVLVPASGGTMWASSPTGNGEGAYCNGGAYTGRAGSPAPTGISMVPAWAGRVARPYGDFDGACHGRTEAPAPTGGVHGRTEAADRAGAEQEAVQMRLWEEMAKNRVLDMELAWANKRIRVEAERREAKRQLCKEALKLLGWLAVGVLCGGMAVACFLLAPKWTCIAPAVLTALAVWRAGEEV